MQSEGAQCFSILAYEPLKPDSSDKPKFDPDLKDVPEVYHEFADVFSRQKADTLLLHWDYDLKINIDKGAKIPVGPIHPLSGFKLRIYWWKSQNQFYLSFKFSIWSTCSFYQEKERFSLTMCWFSSA
jgi:hypothetical protein